MESKRVDGVKKKFLTNLYTPSNTFWKQAPLKSTHLPDVHCFLRGEMNLKSKNFAQF